MTQNQGSPCALLAAVGCSAHVPLAPHCALRASCSALAETAGRVYQDHVAHLELFSFSTEQKRERELAFVLETASQRENERCLTEKGPFLFFIIDFHQADWLNHHIQIQHSVHKWLASIYTLYAVSFFFMEFFLCLCVSPSNFIEAYIPQSSWTWQKMDLMMMGCVLSRSEWLDSK